MKKLLLIPALVVAFATSASASSVVAVTMHDPGCHWFSKGGKFVKSMTVSGPAKLANYDEAPLVIKGPHGTQIERVGKTVTLGKGVYHITMVHQAPDDNHLTLTVR